MTGKPTFESLPPEIRLSVLPYLTFEERANLRSTSSLSNQTDKNLMKDLLNDTRANLRWRNFFIPKDMLRANLTMFKDLDIDDVLDMLEKFITSLTINNKLLLNEIPIRIKSPQALTEKDKVILDNLLLITKEAVKGADTESKTPLDFFRDRLVDFVEITMINLLDIVEDMPSWDQELETGEIEELDYDYIITVANRYIASLEVMIAYVVEEFRKSLAQDI